MQGRSARVASSIRAYAFSTSTPNLGYGFKKELRKASSTSGAPRDEETQVLVVSDSARRDSGFHWPT